MDEFIFTITALVEGSTNGKRTWGWYPTFEQAEKHVLQGDDTLLESGTFDYLMIEEVPVGAFTICERQWWYKADCHRWEENGHPTFDYTVIACPCPKWAKNITNFSMG
jgi:hypothetical protein